jgi:hypothetical protein
MDKEILEHVKRTRGSLSESERAKRLLRCALDPEKRVALEREIAGFLALACLSQLGRFAAGKPFRINGGV